MLATKTTKFILYTILSLACVFAIGSFFTRNRKNQNYSHITQEEAKTIMDTQKDFIILDVRTQEEFNEGHIPNAILIPDFLIKTKAPTVLTDKDQLILVYCRSGRRSKNAAEALVSLGYTNVKEFGGIIDWNYDIIK